MTDSLTLNGYCVDLGTISSWQSYQLERIFQQTSTRLRTLMITVQSQMIEHLVDRQREALLAVGKPRMRWALTEVTQTGVGVTFQEATTKLSQTHSMDVAVWI